MNKIIPITKPSITQHEIELVNDAVTNGWGRHWFDYIKKFEDKTAQYLNVKYTMATSSCTGALHLAFAALNLHPGDEVIVPEITWIASVAPITYFKAKPVFVDVLEDSWCINPKMIEKSITRKTKAILIVNVYGNVCEMEEIRKIADKYCLPVIEDAAESLGSEYKNKKTGSFGDISVFSFHGTKIATTGEGGLITTNSEKIYKQLLILNDHGRDPNNEKVFWMEQLGYKYKMSNIQAALGVAQLDRIDELIEKKIKIFNWYKNYFDDTEKFGLNPELSYVKNIFWMPTLIIKFFNEEKRNTLVKYLSAEKIYTRPFFYPVSQLPMFEKANNPVAYNIYGKGINLPSYFEMDEKDVEYVSKKILRYLEK